MQAMAPGSKVALHDGHSAGAGAAAGLPLAAGAGMGVGGPARTGVGEGGGTGRPAVAAAGAPATTGSRTGALAGAAASMNACLHVGQRSCLPAASSGIWMGLLQCGQRVICGMTYSRMMNEE